MALDQKALQKKRAKREQKRKEAKQVVAGLSGALSKVHAWTVAARAPIADVLVPTNLFDIGLGTLWLSRQLRDGRYAMVGILVDTYCLGVKNALYKVFEASEYRSFLAHVLSSPERALAPADPAYARKLIEGAAAYAQGFGFEPHADYRIARLLFGDIDAAACPVEFTFGRDGKPLYIEGPDDTPATQRRILEQLERRRGPGSSDFLIGQNGDNGQS